MKYIFIIYLFDILYVNIFLYKVNQNENYFNLAQVK
jgi:hypothetical protein